MSLDVSCSCSIRIARVVDPEAFNAALGAIMQSRVKKLECVCAALRQSAAYLQGVCLAFRRLGEVALCESNALVIADNLRTNSTMTHLACAAASCAPPSLPGHRLRHALLIRNV